MLPLRLFDEPVFNIVSAALFLTTLSFFTVIVFVPVFLQTVTGVSATESGVILLALLITGTLSTIVSGRAISKTGRYKRFPLLGLAIMALGLVALSTLDARHEHGHDRARCWRSSGSASASSRRS